MHLRPAEPHIDDFYIQMASAHDIAPAAVYEDPLDDIFGSDSEAPPFGSGSREQVHADQNLPPDTRRLQVTHSTTGYREGITEGKAQSIQAGFDEGYGLGANIGLKAGHILGLLEGITAALGQHSAGDADHPNEHARVNQLLVSARVELKTESIFDEACWTPDGSWKYDVESSRHDGEILFEDVAEAPPLITKWTRTAHEEMQRWDLHLELPALKSEEQPSEGDATPKTVKLEQQSRQVLDW